jgi:probable F420-dependent oxidoreductase
MKPNPKLPIPADAARADDLLPRALGRVGVWTAGFDSVPVAAAQDAAASLDEAGYGALWFGEAYGRESLTQASLLLAATQRTVIATGIASIYGRDPVAARGAQATLLNAFPERFLLGLGVSHRPMVERFRRGAYGPPLQEMSRYLDGMDDVTPMAIGGDVHAPRVLAALGPRMLALARDKADGAHSYLVTPQHTAEARAALGPGKLLAVEQAVVLSVDPEVVGPRARTHLEIYTGLPNYRASWARQGFGEDDWVRGGSDRLRNALVVSGQDAIRARVQQHLDAGADHVCIQVLGEHALALPTDDLLTLAPALTSI